METESLMPKTHDSKNVKSFGEMIADLSHNQKENEIASKQEPVLTRENTLNDKDKQKIDFKDFENDVKDDYVTPKTEKKKSEKSDMQINSDAKPP